MTRVGVKEKTLCMIPVKSLSKIKTRLAPVMSHEDRIRLSFAMLKDVISAVRLSGFVREILIVTPDPTVSSVSEKLECHVVREKTDRGVNAAVVKGVEYADRERYNSLIILPSDIPLTKPIDIRQLVSAHRGKRGVVMTPSVRLDGTNALVMTPPSIMPTYYERDSFTRHVNEVRQRGIAATILLSRRIMLDIDSPEDLFEFLKEGKHTRTYEFASTLFKSNSDRCAEKEFLNI